MIMDAEKDRKPIPCMAWDSQITKVGKVIRTTRIDELPQTFNILAGDGDIIRTTKKTAQLCEFCAA